MKWTSLGIVLSICIRVCTETVLIKANVQTDRDIEYPLQPPIYLCLRSLALGLLFCLRLGVRLTEVTRLLLPGGWSVVWERRLANGIPVSSPPSSSMCGPVITYANSAKCTQLRPTNIYNKYWNALRDRWDSLCGKLVCGFPYTHQR